ncbi:MAG: hypothetical protein GY759_20355 [Chloroflexi bacterium]|nr:hypothetical protein [Chloroflexota bacterium]
MNGLRFHLGVKADPIENRYSYEWLFRLLADEDIHHLQLGSFVAMFHMSDGFFTDLKQLAADFGIQISTIFTSHREMGGFFRHDHIAWGETTERLYRRLIEIGALVGASAVGANPGAAMRDRLDYKAEGLQRYLTHIQAMTHYAHDCGLAYLTIEPMSCLAEPPTLPDEIRTMAAALTGYHEAHPTSTVPVGYCVDVSHGYANQNGEVIWDHMQLLEAALPNMHHVHLKNTDSIFNSTFGFLPEERANGIVNVSTVREVLQANANLIPMSDLICYLEIGGPKTGRDYSDYQLEGMLRGSLQYLKENFLQESGAR